MSAFAGVYYYNSQIKVEQELRFRLIELINRSNKNEVVEFESSGFFIVHIDVKAFDNPSFTHIQNTGAIAIAGQLLLTCSMSVNITNEAEYFALSPDTSKTTLLRTSRGTFCFGEYSKEGHRLLLAVDRLGVRPLYYHDDGHRLIFATALRVFEGLARYIPLKVDMQAVTELNAFGYPLGRKTPFIGVKCMRGGEAITVENGVSRLNTYWRWDRVPEFCDKDVDTLSNLNSVFMDSVKIRLLGDRCANAFLSGGLDSRCIVTALRSLNLDVHTFNMSWKHTYDEVLGAAYAERIGTHHHSVMLPENKAGGAWPGMISSILQEISIEHADAKPDRKRVIWSGDGGSVGMGRVYLNEEMIEALRNKDVETAVKLFMKYNYIAVPRGVLQPAVRTQIIKSFLQSIKEEFVRFECTDSGKALFLFLLENDQRRHMSLFYEEIDVNRVEYLMPFFDGEFLAAATALPLDGTLYHRFYNNWLKTFGEATIEVPWQAYPGHEPCPHQMPVNAEYQWGRNPRGSSLLQRYNQAKIGINWAFSQDLPTNTFSRCRMIAVGIMAAVTGRNYLYLLKTPNKYVHYLQLCGCKDTND